MKHLLIIMLLVQILSCHHNDVKSRFEVIDSLRSASIADTANYTTIQWLDSIYLDYGTIRKDQTLAIIFRFKNTGNKPLIISYIHPSCGCTVVDQLIKPILPGQVDSITAKFKPFVTGMNEKYLAVAANTKPKISKILKFRVKVEQ